MKIMNFSNANTDLCNLGYVLINEVFIHLFI